MSGVGPDDSFGRIASDALDLVDRILELSQAEEPLSEADWQGFCEEHRRISNRYCDLRDWLYGDRSEL